MSRASALVNKNYPTDNQPIYKPKHEILHGLSICTKMLGDNLESIPQYVSFDDMQADFDQDIIWVNDLVQLGDKTTSYGREKIADILGINSLDDLMGKDRITAKNIYKIYEILNAFDGETRMQKIHEMEQFALEMVTLDGSTTLPLSQIYYEVPDEYKNRIKEIIDSDQSESSKIRDAEELYSEMVADMMSKHTKEEIDNINDTDRAKMSAIQSMMIPQFMIDNKGKLRFAENPLADGMTEDDLMYHAAQNRELLSVKADMTPLGGFLTRQLVELGRKVVMLNKTDDENPGLLIPRKLAEGRTEVTTGRILPKSDSDELVAVRSILTTNLPYATPDMFNSNIEFSFDRDGKNYIGLDWMTELSSAMTQSALSLKHSGTARYVDKWDKFIAPYDTEVEFLEDRIHLKATDEYYVLPNKFSTRGNGFYKKGDLIGEIPLYKTVSYRIESMIKFISAQGSLSNHDIINKFDLTRCFNGSTPVTVEYDGKHVKLGKVVLGRDRFIHYPIGSTIPPYKRFTSGVQNMKDFDKSSIQTKYNIFYNQLSELRGVSSEMIELFMYLIYNRKISSNYLGIMGANVKENQSALSAIAYGYAGKQVRRILSGDLELNKEDPFSKSMLTPLLYKLITKIYGD